MVIIVLKLDDFITFVLFIRFHLIILIRVPNFERSFNILLISHNFLIFFFPDFMISFFIMLLLLVSSLLLPFIIANY